MEPYDPPYKMSLGVEIVIIIVSVLIGLLIVVLIYRIGKQLRYQYRLGKTLEDAAKKGN